MEKQFLYLLESLELPDGNFKAEDVPGGEGTPAALIHMYIYRFIFTI